MIKVCLVVMPNILLYPVFILLNTLEGGYKYESVFIQGGSGEHGFKPT